jgi:hypothetical protein
MSNNESELERRAGVDMVPVGESFEWNPEPDGGAAICKSGFYMAVTAPDERSDW